MTGKLLFKFVLFFCIVFSLMSKLNASEKYTLVIHGGAGNIPRENLTNEQVDEYLSTLTIALNTGGEMLEAGEDALDVAVAVVNILEDSPLFNAGKGAVFNIEGQNELDASIMCGKTRNAGAVAGVTRIKNPINAAREVMENSPHVMLVGKGAEQFAYERGVEIVDPSYFFDQKRWDQYKEALRRSQGYLPEDNKMGTVGAVVMDVNGNLAAATSTGGMTAKRYGRIGDSPIIGAGTYADNDVCAVSATGHGEYFIRNVIAYDIAAQMKYANIALEDVANSIINGRLVEQNANGGIIAVDKDGNIAMIFNTSAMFRGFVNEKGEKEVKIFAE